MKSIFEVPYRYLATVIPPGKQKPRGIVALQTAVVRIPVAEPSSMPVAIRWLNSVDCRSGRNAERFESDAASLRWDGKRLLEHAGDAMSGDGIQAALRAMHGTPFAQGQRGEYYEADGEAPGTRPEGRILYTDEAQARARALQAMEGALICDGRFWEPCAEPAWQVEDHGNYVNVNAVRADPREMSDMGRFPLYSADCFDQARAHAEGEAERHGDGRLYVQGRIDVLDRRALAVPFADLRLIRASRDFLSREAKELHAKDRGFVMVYLDLRDAAAEAGDRAGPALEDAIGRMLDATPRFEDAGERWRNSAREELQDSLSRWTALGAGPDHEPLPAPGPR